MCRATVTEVGRRAARRRRGGEGRRRRRPARRSTPPRTSAPRARRSWPACASAPAELSARLEDAPATSTPCSSGRRGRGRGADARKVAAAATEGRKAADSASPPDGRGEPRPTAFDEVRDPVAAARPAGAGARRSRRRLGRAAASVSGARPGGRDPEHRRRPPRVACGVPRSASTTRHHGSAIGVELDDVATAKAGPRPRSSRSGRA